MKLTAALILRLMDYDEAQATAEANIKNEMFSSRARDFMKLFLFTNIAFSLLSKMVQLIWMIIQFHSCPLNIIGSAPARDFDFPPGR